MAGLITDEPTDLLFFMKQNFKKVVTVSNMSGSQNQDRPPHIAFLFLKKSLALLKNTAHSTLPSMHSMKTTLSVETITWKLGIATSDTVINV